MARDDGNLDAIALFIYAFHSGIVYTHNYADFLNQMWLNDVDKDINYISGLYLRKPNLVFYLLLYFS